jgi:hypothetical protein
MEQFVRTFYEWFPYSFSTYSVPFHDVAGGPPVTSTAETGGLFPRLPDRHRLRPLSPSFGEDYISITGHCNDCLDQDICEMARYAGIDTVMFLFEPGEFRATTEILATDLNPYSRLIDTAGSSAIETHRATVAAAALVQRLAERKKMFSRKQYIGNDDRLATVWFPADGLFYGSTLRREIPLIGRNAELAGIETWETAAARMPGDIVWTPTRPPL